MGDEAGQGCARPAEGPIIPKSKGESTGEDNGTGNEEVKMTVMVGKEAPDFGATAYHEGGFKNIKLSDFRGKWVFLCFYPGDFTFV